MLFIDKVYINSSIISPSQTKDVVGPISTAVSKLCKIFKNFIIVHVESLGTWRNPVTLSVILEFYRNATG